MGCDETATVCGTEHYEHRGTLTDIIELTTNGNGAYLAVLNDQSRWYRFLNIATDEPIQYLTELADLRTAQRRQEEVSFTAQETVNGVYRIKSYQVHHVPRGPHLES